MLMVHGESDTEADHCGKRHGSVAFFSIDRDKCRIDSCPDQIHNLPVTFLLMHDGQ